MHWTIPTAAAYRHQVGIQALWGCPEGGDPVLGPKAGNVVQPCRVWLQSQTRARVADAPVAEALELDPPTALFCRQLVRHQPLANDCRKALALVACWRPGPGHRQYQPIDAQLRTHSKTCSVKARQAIRRAKWQLRLFRLKNS